MNLTPTLGACAASKAVAHPVKQSSSASSKRNGCVYTEIVPDCKKARPLFADAWLPKAVIPSDGWHGYDGLVDVGYSKHF